MRIILLILTAMFVSCASPSQHLDKPAKRVRATFNYPPRSCVFLEQLVVNWDMRGYHKMWIRNRAAEIGANYVKLIGTTGMSTYEGEAYDCPDQR